MGGNKHEAFVWPVDLGALPTGAAKAAVETLGRRIANDFYGPGQTMPNEAELAQSLNVGRATIRDAIKVLSGKGMVRTARRYGTRVRLVEEWNLLDADVVSWHEPTHPRMRLIFAETTELRTIIEPAAAALAAERAEPGQVRILLEAARVMSPAVEDMEALFEADCRFHSTILQATGNLMMRQLKPLLVTMLRVSYGYGVLGMSNEPVTREGHLRVAEAIWRRDPEAARREMREMLEENERTVRRVRLRDG